MVPLIQALLAAWVPAAAHSPERSVSTMWVDLILCTTFLQSFFYVTMWLLFLGKVRSMGVQSPPLIAELITSFPWKVDTVHFSEGIAESCRLVWGWTEVIKINICIRVRWRIFLELVNYVESRAFFPSPPALQSCRVPGVRQSAFPAQIGSLHCTACSHNAKGIRFVFSQIGSISLYFLLNG